jgi:hypothetical protein
MVTDLARRLVRGGHMQDAVLVDLEGHLDLRHAARRRRDDRQPAQLAAVLGQAPLALEHLDRDRRLVVLVRREGLLSFHRDPHVPWDGLRHDAPAVSMPSVSCVTSSSNISFGLCATLAADDAALDGGSVRHGLVGVDPLGWLLDVEVLPEQLLHLGDPGTTSNKHDLVDVRLLEPGVGDGLPDGAPRRLLEQVHVELLELGPRERLGEVDAVEQRLDLDAHLVLAAQRSLGVLALAAQLPERAAVLADVLAVLAFDEQDEVVHDALVEVLAAEVHVAAGGEHLEHTAIQSEHADVERADAEVVHEHVHLLRLAPAFLSSPYAMAAAVGSLMTPSLPSMMPASPHRRLPVLPRPRRPASPRRRIHALPRPRRRECVSWRL